VSQEADARPPDAVQGMPPEQYGDSYRGHTLEIYKTYVEMADRIGSRREHANSFFLTLNTAVVGFVTYIVGTDKISSSDPWLACIAVAGVTLSYLWYRIIKSYKGLNSAKFKVVHEIEKRLPIRPYDAEWESVGRGENPRLYLPFTHVEIFVPWVFLVMHMLVGLRAVPWHQILSRC